VLAGDSDRERAAAAVREHYARGRLTLDEVSERIGRILTARSQADLRVALSDLPRFGDRSDFAGYARSLLHTAARGAMLLVFTSAYLMFSFALFVVLALTVLFQGMSASKLLGFLLVWLVPTYLLSRLWRRVS
jgi:Domain of unknown function (DUF1707)